MDIDGEPFWVGAYMFSDCDNLKSIAVAKDNPNYHSVGNCIIKTANKELIAGCNTSVIPDDGSVTIISRGAFLGCNGLTNMVIPNSVTQIGEEAFKNCASLTSIAIPNSVTQIGGCAFENCESLTSIVIPSKVTNIGALSFFRCKNLVKVDIKGAKRIEKYAFSGCTNLMDVKIPYGVHTIENDAFSGCSSISCIELPDSITSIGNWVFSGHRLKKIITSRRVFHLLVNADDCEWYDDVEVVFI